MQISIHPELKTCECGICYDSNELIPICNNNHSVCENCFHRIIKNNNKCPFCREFLLNEEDIQEEQIELGIYNQTTQTTQTIQTNQTTPSINYNSSNTNAFSPCIIPFFYFMAIIFLSYIFAKNMKHMDPPEQVIFFILLVILFTCMCLFCKKAC